MSPKIAATQIPYSGSDALSFLVPIIGLDIVKINLVVCIFATLCLACIYAKILPPSEANARWRHLSSLLLGISMISFCFGWQMIHLLLQTWGCFLIMKYVQQDKQHIYCLLFAMAYLISIHLHAMTYNYGKIVFDICGPMMVCTQKLTYLSFSLRDGAVLAKESKDKDSSQSASSSPSPFSSSLSVEQIRLSIGRVPSLFEVMSLVFYFPTILVGPVLLYNEFVDYIDGKDLRTTFGGLKCFPSAKRAISSKVAQAFVSALFMLALQDHFPKARLTTPEFASYTVLWKMTVSIIVSNLQRFRYYFVWSMAEASCNMAGFGWHKDDTAGGEVRWDKVSNINIYGVETATSLKEMLASWNIQTAIWLRRICYERSKTHRTLKTFLLCALWHGVYPGYYLSFVCLGVMVQVARQVRRRCRPHFLKSIWRKRFYDFATWLATLFAITYVMMPFTLLELKSVIYYYNCVGWIMHIILAFFILYFAVAPSSSSGKDGDPVSNKNGKSCGDITNPSLATFAGDKTTRVVIVRKEV